MRLLSYFRGEAFQRGVHPPPRKEATARRAIRRLPFPPRVTVPLAQHIGRPARALVVPGEEVVRGQPVAAADDWLSVPHHAPVTGVVEEIGLRPSARGPWLPAIVIRSHPGASQEDLWGEPRDMESASGAAILEAVREAGLVGLGGAAFPTHAKLAVPDTARVHTLVVNGCECEPYLTCDHRIMVEEPDALVSGIRYAMRATGAVRAIVGIEDNKPDAVGAVEAAIARARVPEGEIHAEAVPTKYPQGAEKMLVMALFGTEIPSGALPVSLGMVVSNVGTLAAMGSLLPRGRGLTERVVTVAGPGVARPGDYRVPLGTPLRFVLEQAGAGADAGGRQVILGGPMMGQAVASLDVPVTKGVSGVLVFRHADLAARDGLRTYPCIKCGECVESCPMGLNPSALGMLAAKREYDLMGGAYHLGECFECGCCTYVCPSNIPLVQQFRVAKQVLRERAASRA
ncbi:MAG TPA: electron transport complex subunit RsxC [Usitatibacteraceae bacterium]|nr:electron transport complex subunit RsxC [Usitatibacteraceae bacterium]HRA22379.1 electron transport complex subunit RsxC [Usitatibacteraceae bacterium]